MISLDPAPAAAAQSIDLSRATVNLPWMAGVGALVLAALFLLLYAYRRRLYISEWMLGWLCLAAALFLLSRDFASARATDAAIGVAQFLVICGGLLFVVSVDSFRQRPHVHRLYFVGLLPLFIWFTLAPIALGSWSALVPGHLIAAGVLAAAGVGYLALVRQTKLLGAGVVGASFLLVAALNVWLSLAFSGLSASSSMQLLAGMALLYILAGFGMHLMVFEDMTYELRGANRHLESAQADLRQLVITDPLTGCYNRRFFHEVIGREVQRRRRYRMPLSVLFVDVDRLKVVNDSLGHEAGDRLLQLVATFLLRNIREADYVFRWGGDEFLALISCTEREAVRKAIELQARFARTPEIAGLPPGVGLSVGCSEFQENVDDPMRVVRQADERMYGDKTREKQTLRSGL
jgi:diguanylate cyclase (GGDEF)-like protein